MKAIKRLRTLRFVIGTSVAASLLCLLGINMAPTSGSDGAVSTTATALSVASLGAGAEAPEDKTNPAKVVGSDNCMKCHKSEVEALHKSKHHVAAGKIKAPLKFKKVPKAACIRCHATPQGESADIKSISSVSCESCHGGAKDWLEIHGKKEVARADRHAECDKLGMIRSSDLYRIAKNCFQCHVVYSEALVNEGHPAGNSIELLGWTSGEVRHNFQLNQKKNAIAPSAWMEYAKGNAEHRSYKKYVVGILVELEVTLTYLAVAEDGKGKFAKGHAKRFKASQKTIAKVVKALGGDAPKEITDVAKAIDFKVSSFNFKSQADCKTAAPLVAAAAVAFSKGNDGSKLGKLKDLVSAIKERGTPYSP